MAGAAHIILIGPRATGKTSVGRALAEAVGREFLDLDDLVREAWQGATGRASTVAEIWREAGEGWWRGMEERCFEALFTTRTKPIVLALGGGAPTVQGIERAIQHRRSMGEARVIYLRSGVADLQSRLREGSAALDRPSLTGMGTVEEVAEVLRMREPVYARLADVVVASERGGVQATVNAMQRAIAAM